ncbi:hypothetical protein KSE_65780 [Kitasatospora setae KM-6054]|uniref:Uncharacterized protein n=1 Tax=Kitasatospora setae (strain ATCC 33774 / DSM 43861 / JCM 3304 / KCC A-0304 / NBRC 14216 / KM-6054) TaxID=452652 RepID=E4N2F3_KITSK|nr:hypothetical protein KSE_65780 [Kitasatospora setae KM-6054]
MHGPVPSYPDSAAGPVRYCPVVSAYGTLQGYLWFAEAENAAGFVKMLVREELSGAGHWILRLRDAYGRGLTAAEAVHELATVPHERDSGRPDLAALATAESLAEVEESGRAGWVPPKEPVAPRGYRPLPDGLRLSYEDRQRHVRWLFETDGGAAGDGPVPPEAVLGGWEFDREGRPVRWRPNPRHGVPEAAGGEAGGGTSGGPGSGPGGGAGTLPPLGAGRRPAGRALLGWLDDPRAPRLCRVAGSSGSGRTHLLHWLAAACPADGPRPGRRVRAVLAADGLTPDSFVWRLSALLGTPVADTTALIGTLTDGAPLVLVVTGLDRAGGGLLPDAARRIAEEVLRPLLRVPWLRLVLECASGTAAAEALDVPAAVLDLDEPQWTDPDAYARWCAALAGHPLPADALYPSPGLAVLAARTAPGVAFEPDAGPARKAEVLAEAWWASLPEDVRAPVAVLGAVRGGIDTALWAELPGAGGAAAVDEAAAFLPPDPDGRQRVWPHTFADRLALWAVDHAALRQALLPDRPETAPGPADRQRLGLLLRHGLHTGTPVLDLLTDPDVLVHADPDSVTLAFASFTEAFEQATSPTRLRTGPFSGTLPERDGEPRRWLIESWWLAGPVASHTEEPRLRASALHGWLAGGEEPWSRELAERLAVTAGHDWRVRWSFGRRIEPVRLLAPGHGELRTGRLLVGVGDSVYVIEQADGKPVARDARIKLGQPSTVAVASSADDAAHALWWDGATATIRPDNGSRTSHDALVRLRESMTGGATALTAIGAPRPVLAGGDDHGEIYAIPELDLSEARRCEKRLHDGRVTAVAVAGYGDEHLILSGGEDGRVWTWLPDRTPPEAPTLTRDLPVTALAAHVLPQGLMFAVGWTDGLLQIMTVFGTPLLREIRFGTPIVGLAITPTGLLCAATESGVQAIELAELASPAGPGTAGTGREGREDGDG